MPAAKKFIGLDAHQDTIAIAIADETTGKEVRFFGTIPNTSEALHSALMSGVRAALMRGLSGPEAVEAAIIHASGSVPDAIKALKPDAGVLTRIAEAKLRDAMNELPLFAGVQEGLAG